ncbi:hypothetical protein [Corynebacterium glyciniphilum]|uniref:hypothetical protein n=1 Tax=Corynebacterium glyciniphilum TaxID=1404244 RepID=UPI0011AB7254|nr:hypothetical protein [Corynebacterium glyciniphilum]
MKPHNDTRQRDIARHPASQDHPARREPGEPSVRELVESEFAIVIAFVLGGGFALLVAAQAWHAWGWVGVTGVAALVAVVVLGVVDRR